MRTLTSSKGRTFAYVLQWEEDNKKKLTVTVIRAPRGKNASIKTIILLLMVKEDDDTYQYFPITNLDRLLNTQTNYRNRICCERCHQPFYRRCKKFYEKHRELCHTPKLKKCRKNALVCV